MCGIVGKWNYQTGAPVEQALIQGMARKLVHRGPDDEGFYIQGALGLGFRRLAIIDLSPAGNQPMSNEDGTVWIIFNGEIYNYQELRPDLERRGHKFRSRTDTETIIHLYEEYGEQCVQRLRGMFAFAIWDSRKEQLFLARDRVGKKPLKYYLGPDGIVFASELKAILADPSVPRKIDLDAVDMYLTYQYVPHPKTGFIGIHKLPPAHTLTIHQGKVELKRYWQLDFSKKENRSEGEWSEAIREKLNESVKIRLMSDVPLGAFLSGGVDSSAVVAFMAKNSSQPVKTFSIGFREQSHNELPYAQAIAKMYGTNHTEFIVEPKALDILPKLVYHYEEPYADSSAIPSYYVAQQTRQHVTVALNGDGGDENFAGYPWYPVQAFAQRYAILPGAIQAIVAGGAYVAKRAYPSTLTTRGWRFARGIGESAPQRYLRYMAYFHPDELRTLFKPEYLAHYDRAATENFLLQYFSAAKAFSPIDQALAVDIATYLPDDLLVKVDIATMANSLEGRSPFLDHQFMEFAATIPQQMKIHKGEKKYILKRALEGLVPQENLYRRKMGFSVPLVHWFRHELRSYLEEVIFSRDAFVLTLFKETALRAMFKEHLAGKVDHANRLWALLTLELWYHTFITTGTIRQ